MPVGIMQVINNTSSTLHYDNRNTGYSIEIKTKTPSKWGIDTDVLPCSKPHDDTVPYYNDGYSIRVWVDANPSVKAKISDYNYKFSVLTNVDGTDGFEQKTYGKLVNGGKYVLRVDEKINSYGVKRLAFSFYEYEDKIAANAEAGWVLSSIFQHAAPVVANLLVDVVI